MTRRRMKHSPAARDAIVVATAAAAGLAAPIR